jgi:hypothetical protein
MEPVFMGLGQAAGMAAAMAIDQRTAVQEIDALNLIERLRDDPYLDGRPADIHVAWDHEPDRVAWLGDWTIRVEQRWDSNERYLYVEQPGPIQRVRFSPIVTRTGKYHALFYNPENLAGIKSGRLKVVVRSADGETETSFDPTKHVWGNGSLFSLGEYRFESGSDAEIELIADGAGIPAQAMYVSLVAAPDANVKVRSAK